MAYGTPAGVWEQLCGVDVASLGDAAARQAAVQSALEAATDDVDRRCRRTFVPPESAETRRMNGNGTRLLRTPDIVRLERLEVDGEKARNAHVYPTDGPPFRWIASGQVFPPGHGNVVVTAWWGFGEAVPGDVGRAAEWLAAAEVLKRLQAARSGGASAQAAGSLREEYPPDGPYAFRVAALESHAARILLPYRRWFV